MIIDCHCHAGKGDGLTDPWNSNAPLGDYVQRCRDVGIGHSILIPTFHSDYSIANRQLAVILKRHPGRFSALAQVHSSRDSGRVADLIGLALSYGGFCGIKIHKHDAVISREVCEAARHYSLPILYDVMGDAAVIDLLAKEYPDVEFVIPHLGSFGDDWRAQLALIDIAVRNDNVYADSSGVRRFDLLKAYAKRAGPAKLLFGTDGPWLHPAVELTKILALKLSSRAQALVLSDNARRIFQLR